MQPLERPTPLAGKLDYIGLRLLIFALCFTWFYLLWSRLLPALASGGALALLWCLLIHLGQKRTLAAREISLRRKVGGQLAVDSLVLQNAQSAAANVTTWLSNHLPLEMFEQVADGVLARSDEKRVYVTCLRKHPSSHAERDDVLHAVRAARTYSAEVCVVCATCAFDSDAVLLAEDLQPRTRLLGREGLMRMAGVVTPVTNEQLQELGKLQRTHRFDSAQWKARLIQPGKAKRYGAYGLGMLVMLVLTRQWAYLIPSIACLLLFFFSRRRKEKPFEL